MNKVILIGNLTRDPECSETPNGTAYAVFNLAVNRPYKNADGETETDFFRCVAWRTKAGVIGRYTSKGKKVCVEGWIQQRTYEKDGGKRTITEIVADSIELLSQRENTAQNGDTGAKPPKERETGYQTQIKWTEKKPTLDEVPYDLPF